MSWELTWFKYMLGSDILSKAKKKILFVSCNGPKKNRVGRSAKFIFLVKNVCFMHVLR